MKYFDVKLVVSVVVGMAVFVYVVQKAFGSWLTKGSSYIPQL